MFESIVIVISFIILIYIGSFAAVSIVNQTRLQISPTYEVTPELIGVSRIAGGAMSRRTYYYLDYSINGNYHGGQLPEGIVELRHVEGEPFTITLSCSTATSVCDVDSVMKAVITGDLSTLSTKSSQADDVTSASVTDNVTSASVTDDVTSASTAE